jgi:hypothetical protein
VFVAVFSNCNCNPPAIIGAKIAALAIGKPYEYKEIPVENTLLQSYTGVYENEKSDQSIITLVENQLYSQKGKGKPSKVKAYQKDKFFFENLMTTIEFSKNNKGETEKLTTKGRRGNEDWNKTNKLIPTETKKK